MPRNKYLLRLDDACPTMHAQRWERMESILDRFNILPLVGIIPANADPDQHHSPADPLFWDKAKEWQKKGWQIALHGYDHCFISNERGINPLWDRSEFAGVPFDLQKEKISRGVEILRSHGINPQYFFAPAHTFDLNTLEALRTCSDIRRISDTIGLRPYARHGFSFIPQIGGKCREMPVSGVWTACLHPSMMTDKDFADLETFLAAHASEFITFEDIDYTVLKSKDIRSRLISFLYFTNRRIRHSK